MQARNLDKPFGRDFVSRAAGGLFLILKPKTVWSYQANSAVRLALLGCGNRGTAVATSFAKNTTARVVALGDIFQDQLDKPKSNFDALANSLGYAGPETGLMFRGAHAYQELARSNEIDAIQISTPPFFMSSTRSRRCWWKACVLRKARRR